eukprot:2856783-Rhodomonas_salina.1
MMRMMQMSSEAFGFLMRGAFASVLSRAFDSDLGVRSLALHDGDHDDKYNRHHAGGAGAAADANAVAEPGARPGADVVLFLSLRCFLPCFRSAASPPKLSQTGRE